MEKDTTEPETPEAISEQSEGADGGCEDDSCRMSASTETETEEDCCCCW